MYVHSFRFQPTRDLELLASYRIRISIPPRGRVLSSAPPQFPYNAFHIDKALGTPLLLPQSKLTCQVGYCYCVILSSTESSLESPFSPLGDHEIGVDFIFCQLLSTFFFNHLIYVSVLCAAVDDPSE